MITDEGTTNVLGVSTEAIPPGTYELTVDAVNGEVLTVTADAMFTHADVCETILEEQGDYVLYAKDNQARLRADIEATFAAAESGGLPPLAPAAVAGGRPDDHLAG